jgi:PIN domain
MVRITRPSPPEHLVLVDTNILWTDDKAVVVNPAFDAFWAQYSAVFPMKLIVPGVVRGELLFQQVTSATKLLEKANDHFDRISKITTVAYAHRVTANRIKKHVEERFEAWLQAKRAEIKEVPIPHVDWAKVIDDSIWRVLPFTGDSKERNSEKGFRDYMILETVCAVCKYYSPKVNIAFICDDFPLRQAADSRLGLIDSFTSYESLTDFISFIELTRKDLTERFVKSILAKAREKFHSETDNDCLIYKDRLVHKIRDQFRSRLENPVVPGVLGFMDYAATAWQHIGQERIWVTRPQFYELERSDVYHWKSRVTYYRLYERQQLSPSPYGSSDERRMVKLGVDVHWKATVRSDGRFFHCEVVDYKESEYAFDVPTDKELEQYRLLPLHGTESASGGLVSPETSMGGGGASSGLGPTET